MTASEVGAVPDDVIEEAACSRCKGNGREPLANATIGAPACYLCGGTGQRTDPMVAVLADAIASARAEQPARGGESDHAAGRAVLSVPALRDALARDAQANCHAITGDDGTSYCPLAERDARDAARLRSLAATFDGHLNRDKTFTGPEVASMLRPEAAT